MLAQFTEIAADAIGRAVATMQREFRQAEELREAKLSAKLSEIDAGELRRDAEIRRIVEERLASIQHGRDGEAGLNGRDGKDADPEAVRAMVAEAIAAIPVPKDGAPGRDGRDVTPEDVAPLVDAAVARAVEAMPVPQNGRDAPPLDVSVVEAAVAEHVERAVAAIPKPKDGEAGRDGKDIDLEAVAGMVAAEVARLPPARDGKDVDPEFIADAVTRAVSAAVGAIELPAGLMGPPGNDGVPGAAGRDGANGIDGAPGNDGTPGPSGEKGDRGEPGERGVDGAPGIQGSDGAPGARGDQGEQGEPGLSGERGERGEHGERGEPGPGGPAGERGVDGTPGERGQEGPPGKLPLVRAWSEGVFYEGDVVAHDGATYQALRDTGRDPSHDDWRCIAAAGRAGVDGRSFTIRGTYRDDEAYERLDVVMLGGSSFAARRDVPGQCPGEGWQVIATPGKIGKPGERGPKGDQGKPGQPVVAADINSEGLQTLTNGDGSTVTCDLYPLLAKALR